MNSIGCRFPFVFTLILTLLLMNTNYLLANGGVFSPQQRITGSLWPMTLTNIEIEKEILTLDFITEKRWLTSVNVEAKYFLSNKAHFAENVVVGFPVPSGVQLAEVILGDKVLDYNVTQISLEGLSEVDDKNRNWLQENVVWLDPITGQEYATHELETWKQVNILIFEMSLKPLEETELTVRYAHPPSFDRYKYVNYIYHFDYLLEPASFWSNFGSLTIKFKVPQNWSFASNLEVERIVGSNNIYEGHYQGLPKNILNISLISKEGFWFGQGTMIGVWIIAILSMFTISFLVGVLKPDNTSIKAGAFLIIALIIKRLFSTFTTYGSSEYLNMLLAMVFLLGLSVRIYDMASKKMFCKK